MSFLHLVHYASLPEDILRCDRINESYAFFYLENALTQPKVF
jgi:hypothetical protein